MSNRYAGIIKNDVSAGEGVCVSLFVQGCNLHCPGCHNPQTWAEDGGYSFTPKVMNEILEAIDANGVHRNFCVMGGEPFGPAINVTAYAVDTVRSKYGNNIKIYVWTGYTLEDLKEQAKNNPLIDVILKETDVLIDGPFIQAQRDITLPMRGSKNQRILDISQNI